MEPPPPPLVVTMYWMGECNNPEIFLETMAEACQGPAAEWAPLLSGEAQTVSLNLPPALRGSFKDICCVVLDH